MDIKTHKGYLYVLRSINFILKSDMMSAFFFYEYQKVQNKTLLYLMAQKDIRETPPEAHPVAYHQYLELSWIIEPVQKTLLG